MYIYVCVCVCVVLPMNEYTHSYFLDKLIFFLTKDT